MKKLLLSFLLLALILPVFGQNQDEFKFSLVPRRASGGSVTGVIKADGTVPLTANWPMGAFELSQATWKGVTIGVGYGGTGLTSYAVGDILHATATGTIGKLADVAVGQVLVSGGVGAVPAYSASPTVTGNIGAANITANQTPGSELITGATAISTWTPVTRWAYTTSWDHTSGNATILISNWTPSPNVKYKIIVANTTGTAGTGYTMSCGSQTFAAVTATGSNTFYMTAGDATALSFSAYTWVGSITSVSVVALTNGQVTAESIVLNSGLISSGNGNAILPAYTFANATGSGMWWDEANARTSFSVSGTKALGFSATGLYFVGTAMYFGASSDLIIGRGGAGMLMLGVVATSPIDQIIKPANAVGADKTGAMLTLQGGPSTGTGMGGGVCIQTPTTSTTSSTLNTEYTRYRAVGKVVTLTDASATDVISFGVVAGQTVGGMLVYTIKVQDNDASDFQVESGTVIFCGLQDEANWHTNISEVSTQALESGALATTWAIDTATANTLKITCLADSDLTTPVITVRYQLFLNSPIVETIL